MYTKIESRFWDDDKFDTADDACKLLSLFLLSSKHRNIIGLYLLPSAYAKTDLKWGEKKFEKAFAKLLQEGFIKYDSATQLVFIVNFLKPDNNPLENPNQVTAAIKKIKELPSTPLFADLLETLSRQDKPFYKPLLELLRERLRNPSANGMPNP